MGLSYTLTPIPGLINNRESREEHAIEDATVRRQRKHGVKRKRTETAEQEIEDDQEEDQEEEDAFSRQQRVLEPESNRIYAM